MYNPNTVAKFKLETKTENKDGNNRCPLVRFISAPLTCVEGPKPLPPAAAAAAIAGQMSRKGCERGSDGLD